MSAAITSCRKAALVTETGNADVSMSNHPTAGSALEIYSRSGHSSIGGRARPMQTGSKPPNDPEVAQNYWHSAKKNGHGETNALEVAVAARNYSK